MHSNLHHESIDKLPAWFEQVKDIFDFWPFAYYPYYMRKDECGLGVEDIYPMDKVQADWEYVRKFTEKLMKRDSLCSWGMNGRELEKMEIITFSF